MVPVTATEHVDVRAALRSRLAKSCRRELSAAFRAWLLRESETDAKFASLANRAAAKEGAQQDFQTVAVLGFAAHAGVLGAAQIEALRRGVIRQAGRDAVFDGVPMPFCFDAVGVLGVSLGTRAIGDVNITSQVVQWITKFLRSSYEKDRAEEWPRCLFAVADRLLESPLDLSIPKSAATADVRIALLSRGLIDVGDRTQIRQDAAHTLEMAVQEPPEDFSCDQAALRLAALEFVTRTARVPADESLAEGGAETVTEQNASEVPAEMGGDAPANSRASRTRRIVPPRSAVQPARNRDKGNLVILLADGKLKNAVTLDTARRFGGVTKRAIERAVKKGALASEGERRNRRIVVESLLKYFPPENNAT